MKIIKQLKKEIAEEQREIAKATKLLDWCHVQLDEAKSKLSTKQNITARLETEKQR